jgi:hypothetical protein
MHASGDAREWRETRARGLCWIQMHASGDAREQRRARTNGDTLFRQNKKPTGIGRLFASSNEGLYIRQTRYLDYSSSFSCSS